MNVEIEAEQFLPYEDKVPQGVQSDGTSDPRTNPRAGWFLKNSSGAVYINDGDYVITLPSGDRYIVSAETFEQIYKPTGE